MRQTDDSALLKQFLETRSEDAFTALVERHVNLVYSVALRHTGDAGQAEEISQAVFIILARKAAQLRSHQALSSWLFQTTRLTANNLIRSEMRRRRREQEAHMQSTWTEHEPETWSQIAPMLDAAVASLNETERCAVLMRFYEGRNFREIGALLGASEDAAQKRLTRAMEKLQRFFAKRGVTSTAAVIATALAANSVHAAPAGMAGIISAVAVGKTAAAGSTLTLLKGALKIMAWTKAKTAIVAGAAVLMLATGTTTVVLVTRPSADELTQQGWMLLNTGKRPQAVVLFKKATSRDPKSADAWNGLGWGEFNSGDAKDGETSFKKAVALQPEHPAALNGLGQIYLAQGKLDDAETYLLKAAPNAPAAWFGLARLYLLQEKYDDAEQWAQRLADSGQTPDEIVGKMLAAAKAKKVDPKLMAMLKAKGF